MIEGLGSKAPRGILRQVGPPIVWIAIGGSVAAKDHPVPGVREDLRHARVEPNVGRSDPKERHAYVARADLRPREMPGMSVGFVVESNEEIPGCRRKVLHSLPTLQRRLPDDLGLQPQPPRLELDCTAEIAVVLCACLLFLPLLPRRQKVLNSHLFGTPVPSFPVAPLPLHAPESI